MDGTQPKGERLQGEMYPKLLLYSWETRVRVDGTEEDEGGGEQQERDEWGHAS